MSTMLSGNNAYARLANSTPRSITGLHGSMGIPRTLGYLLRAVSQRAAELLIYRLPLMRLLPQPCNDIE
ncbi:hypothetical protein AOQ71_29260 [Bradyrhizobium manausense]|uniref:Uncharacterized protein n=1 Tax=Bradyrhizobium manausense TaxID=989370 RepID=A0A0R3D537_9BRAD|nr:hypothetical protein AOQ71_29260 [Bradyrhizobium manausense]